MNEGFPIGTKNQAEGNNDSENLVEVDTEQVEQVYKAISEYAKKEGEGISDEALHTAAVVLVQRAAERGEEIDLDHLPLKEIVNARQEIAGLGTPVVDAVTGEVVRVAKSPNDARKKVIEQNEGLNQQ